MKNGISTIKEIIKKDDINFHRKKVIKKGISNRNFIKKSFIIFMLIISYIYPNKSDKNIIPLQHQQIPATTGIRGDEKATIGTTELSELPLGMPLEQYHESVLPEIKSFENNISLSQEEFYEFRKINSENKLLEENPNFKESLNPDITVVLTMYNQAHCIYKGLRSIQNQSIKNIEIIIVDDCSEDNSTDLIKEYQKEDPRIILITHDTNESRMKARVDGIRKARGKYITLVDGDDALIHKDILKHLLYIAQKGKLDVVEFKGSGYQNGRPVNVVYNYYGNNFSNIIHQPELRTKFIKKKYNNNYCVSNTVIWAKLIKNDVFQKVLEYMGTEYADEYSNENEDALMAMAVFHVAKSYYISKELGYYNSYDEKKNYFPKTKIGKCKVNNIIKKFALFKFYKFMVDKHSNEEQEKISVLDFMYRQDNRPILQNNNFNDKHYQILFYIFDKMLSWNCWNQRQRDYIIQQKNLVIKRKNNINLEKV